MTLRTTNAALWLLGAVLVALPAHAQGTTCVEPQLPSLDCIATPNSECCTPKPFTDQDNDTRLCDQGYYWYQLSQGMSSTRAQQHNSAYHMQTETFPGWPDALYDGASTWSRHFVDVALFAGTVYENGKSWHSPNLDYSPLARARSNPFHQDFSTLQVTRLDGEGDPGARWTSNFWDDGSIRLACDYFREAPILQAAILLHESWHGVYGGHDFSGQDHYHPRTKDMIPAGEMNTPFVPLGSTIFSQTHQSVYQTELYFICDVMDRPTRWLANRTISQARFGYPALRGRLIDPDPDIVCGVESLRTDQRIPAPPAPGVPPRVIKMRVLGQLTDGTPLGEATHHPIDFSSETEIVSGVGFEGFPLQVYRSAKDDTEFRFFAEARLVDNETVEVRFQGEFYEDPPDCEGDTSPDSVLVEGQQCKGLEGREFWRRFTLNSRDPLPPPITFDLSNCWDETEAGQCEDFAQGTIAFEIDW